MRARRDATYAAPAGGLGAAISASTAEGRSRVLAWKLVEEEGKMHGSLLGAARKRKLGAWKQFKVLRPAEEITRWARVWKPVGTHLGNRGRRKELEGLFSGDGVVWSKVRGALFSGPLAFRSYFWEILDRETSRNT